MFRINEVISVEGITYRILAEQLDEIVWISLDNEAAFPSVISRLILLDAIDNEMLQRIEDPYAKLYYAQPDEGTKARELRDKNYLLIEPLISNPECMFPRARNRVVNQIIATQGTTKRNLYRLVRRYWQRGQMPNALLPDYENSGGRGKKRVVKDSKLGRPRLKGPGVGALIDEQIERLFRTAIEKHYLVNNGKSFSETHNKFKGMYENYNPDVPESEFPTIWQMKHFFKREYSQVEKLKKRISKIDYNKDIRPLLATANTQVLGPGTRYEIDATIADIYLVSDSDRQNIVGRPIVYMVIDVFSRMVAGFYIGFENPSYVAAMQTLSVAMTDKIKLCKQFGIEIDESDWPVKGIPDAILADRGELLGCQIESLEKSFSTRIENTPPFRGDCKGIVERFFRTIQAVFKPFAPGVVSGTTIKKRGGKDYRLDAMLNIHEFTSIILSAILFHNRYHVLETYDRDNDIPADLPMTPLSLWNWGLQHRSGRLRMVPEDALRVSLLPRTKATISPLGLRVFGVYYTCQEILKMGWLHRGKDVSRPESVEVAYDPAVADVVYLLPRQNSAEYWACGLTERSREFRGCSFWDVWLITKQQKVVVAESKLVADREKRRVDELIDSKIKQAKAQVQVAGTQEMSDRQRIAAIRGNRAKAKDKERKRAEPVTTSELLTVPATVIQLSPGADDYKYPDFIDELFKDD